MTPLRKWEDLVEIDPPLGSPVNKKTIAQAMWTGAGGRGASPEEIYKGDPSREETARRIENYLAKRSAFHSH